MQNKLSLISVGVQSELKVDIKINFVLRKENVNYGESESELWMVRKFIIFANFLLE